MIAKLIELLEQLRKEHGADGVKVYFVDENNYCIKLIKDDKVIKCFRIGRKDGWDVKKNER